MRKVLAKISFKVVFILFTFLFILVGYGRVVGFQDYYPTIVIDNHSYKNTENIELLKGKKIEADFKAEYNNLGIVALKFSTYHRINDDYLQFSIKEKGKIDWYYSNKYKVDQFQNLKYFPFGFPEIKDSRGKIYEIKVESLNGREGNSVQVLTKKNSFVSKYNFSKKYLLENKREIPVFLLSKIKLSLISVSVKDYFFIFLISTIFGFLIGPVSLSDKKYYLSSKKNSKHNLISVHWFIAYIVASICAIFIFYIARSRIILIGIESVFTNKNVAVYVISVFLFCCVFVLVLLMMKKLYRNLNLNNYVFSSNLNNTIIFVALLLFLLFIWAMLTSAEKIVGYESVNYLLPIEVMILILLVGALFFSFIKLNIVGKFKIENKIFWVLISIIIAGLTSCFLYAPNSVSYSYDYGAYYNSVYLLQQGIPYSENFTSAYGHYGIFLGLLFRVIKLNPYSLVLVMVIINFISIMAVIYVMFNLVKNSFFRFLGLFVLMFPFVRVIRQLPYPQSFPHRYFFSSIMMALAVCLIQKKYNRSKVLWWGYIVATFSIIWNCDTGIVCLVSWGILHAYLLLFQKSFCKFNFLKFLIPIFAIVLSFLSAWGLTGFYNILLGGRFLSLYYFLFPLMENIFIVNILHMEIPLDISHWMFVLILFLSFIGLGGTNIPILNKKVEFNKKVILSFYISILGVGQLLYFINRPAYFNILVCYYQLVLLLLLISENTFFSFLKINKSMVDVLKTISFYCVFGTIISFLVIIYLNFSPKLTFMQSFINMQSVKDIDAYLSEKIGKDTPIVGVNSTAIGIALGWKNELGLTDWPNLFMVKNRENMVEKLVNYGKPFLIEKDAYLILRGFNGEVFERFREIDVDYEIRELEETYGILNRYYSRFPQSGLLYFIPKK